MQAGVRQGYAWSCDMDMLRPGMVIGHRSRGGHKARGHGRKTRKGEGNRNPWGKRSGEGNVADSTGGGDQESEHQRRMGSVLEMSVYGHVSMSFAIGRRQAEENRQV